MKVSLFIPAYNEEKTLEKSYLRVRECLDRSMMSYEIWIVDDGSVDATPSIGRRLSRHRNTHYLRYGNGPSRRENLAKAFRKARGSIVAFTDADISADIGALGAMLEELKASDIAIGSRYAKGARANRKPMRLAISKAYNAALRLLFSSSVSDHQCGLKAFRKGPLLGLLDEMGYDSSFSRGWFWDAELLIRAQRKGLRISEVPVRWSSSQKSSFSISREMRMVPRIIRMGVLRK